MRIGLVLGAGGVTGGAFHAGVLAALQDVAGWDARTAEVIVGTSAGSLPGAVLRAGLPPVDLRHRATGRPLTPEGRRVSTGLAPPPSGFPLRPSAGPRPRAASADSLRRMATRPWEVRPGAVLSALLPPGRISTSMITGGIEPLFGRTWPGDALWICAVRLDTGRRVVFGRDEAPTGVSVGEAVAASCAIPSFFEPVEIGGVRHVDGGVHSPTNADLLGGLGLDLVVVSSPMSQAGRSLPRPSADWAVRTFCRAQLDREAAGVRRRGTPVLAFQPTAEDASVMGLNAMDAGRRAAVADRAYESVTARLGRADVRDRVRLLA
jgi:NTE family protein